MNKLIILSCLLALPALAAEKLTVVSSPQQTAVVELYTSEGCSSCPPADQWFEALIDVPKEELDVLALAFHVDYWDYIGWKDRFGSPKHTSRQRQLGANNNQGSIYTPEFFVDGAEARGTRNVIEKIRISNKKTAILQLMLSVSKEGETLRLELQTASEDTLPEILHSRFLVYESQLSSDVTRGENSGETLSHQQVVRYMSPALRLEDNSRHEINIDPDWQLANIGIAAMITSPGNETYLQAVHTPITALLAQQ
ncbi:MAG: DUF1223 domain-containing protein [Gammaproteobacteria bacterium]|nr:MAG: DUF1223 domain-containing protein [Gammaproteobacteria bacterium]